MALIVQILLASFYVFNVEGHHLFEIYKSLRLPLPGLTHPKPHVILKTLLHQPHRILDFNLFGNNDLPESIGTINTLDNKVVGAIDATGHKVSNIMEGLDITDTDNVVLGTSGLNRALVPPSLLGIIITGPLDSLTSQDSSGSQDILRPLHMLGANLLNVDKNSVIGQDTPGSSGINDPQNSARSNEDMDHGSNGNMNIHLPSLGNLSPEKTKLSEKDTESDKLYTSVAKENNGQSEIVNDVINKEKDASNILLNSNGGHTLTTSLGSENMQRLAANTTYLQLMLPSSTNINQMQSSANGNIILLTSGGVQGSNQIIRVVPVLNLNHQEHSNDGNINNIIQTNPPEQTILIPVSNLVNIPNNNMVGYITMNGNTNQPNQLTNGVSSKQ